MAEKWMQKAREGMEAKGTVGAFGKATPKKIAAGIKKGGVAKKRAVLARTFKKVSARRKMGGK